MFLAPSPSLGSVLLEAVRKASDLGNEPAAAATIASPMVEIRRIRPRFKCMV